jgi:ABC-type transport system substrate-binding protein
LVPGYKTLLLVFNEKDPILSNEKVRLAFAHAIDMEPIIKTAFGSSAIPASSTMATTIFGYKNKGFYEYN